MKISLVFRTALNTTLLADTARPNGRAHRQFDFYEKPLTVRPLLRFGDCFFEIIILTTPQPAYFF